ncbi:unnamed protein product [Brassica oleracea]
MTGRPLDFLVISPAKATKDDKSTKNDMAAKDPAYGRGCRRTRIAKGEEADEKKKAARADAALKRKEKAEAKKKAAEDKKKEAEVKKKEAAAKIKVAEAKKKEAELKKKQEAELKKCNVQPDVEDSSLADIIDQVVTEQNEFAPESDVDNSELVRSAITKEFREKNVRILIHERPWPEAEYGWLFDNHVVAYMNVLIKRSMREPTLFWSKRIAFVDLWWQSFLLHDYTQFKMKPTMFLFKGNGYEHMINGRIPDHSRTNLKWYEDVDHLYGCLQTGGNHWVAYHI